MESVMRKTCGYLMTVAILTLALALPSSAGAQTIKKQHDPIWDGLLIGAAVGTVVGMGLGPRVFCGRKDPECAAIVRAVIGLPVIGIGIGVGALVDRLHNQRAIGPAPFRQSTSMKLNFRF
jgi:hypothetical protein